MKVLDDYEKKILKADIEHDKQLLKIEDEEIKERIMRINTYIETKLGTEEEQWYDRVNFQSTVDNFLVNVENSRRLMCRIRDAEEALHEDITF